MRHDVATAILVSLDSGAGSAGAKAWDANPERPTAVASAPGHRPDAARDMEDAWKPSAADFFTTYAQAAVTLFPLMFVAMQVRHQEWKRTPLRQMAAISAPVDDPQDGCRDRGPSHHEQPDPHQGTQAPARRRPATTVPAPATGGAMLG